MTLREIAELFDKKRTMNCLNHSAKLQKKTNELIDKLNELK